MGGKDLYKGKFRRQTVRLKAWNYAGSGRYFITICTQHMRHFFGNVVRGKMELSNMGEIVQEEWVKTFQIRPYIHPDEFVIMPNHVHLIVSIERKVEIEEDVSSEVGVNSVGGGLCHDRDEAAPRRYGGGPAAPPVGISPKAGSLGAVIGSYKAVCARRIRKLGHTGFRWQDGYWDSIIRNQVGYEKIVNYIKNNPKNWQEDGFYDEGCG